MIDRQTPENAGKGQLIASVGNGDEGSKSVNRCRKACGVVSPTKNPSSTASLSSTNCSTSAEVARLCDDWLRILFQHLYATYAVLIRLNITRWIVSGPHNAAELDSQGQSQPPTAFSDVVQHLDP